MTGKYPARLLLTQWLPSGRWSRTKNKLREGRYISNLPLEEVTIAERLKAVGYSTALFGKWDLGAKNWHGKREPTQQGFDQWYGIPGTTHVSQFPTMEGF